MEWSVRDAQEIGERIGIDWVHSKFDPQDLLEGMLVELEHGSAIEPRANVTDDDAEKTAKIAWVHLLESPDYYVLLSEMESLIDAERSASTRAKDGYMRVVQPGQKFDISLSGHLQARTEEYLQKVQKAVSDGATVDEAFKKKPTLDQLTVNQLLALLGENHNIGKVQVNSLASVLKYGGSIFDAIQIALEGAIYHQAVAQWGKKDTKSRINDEKETKVEKKTSAVKAGYFYTIKEFAPADQWLMRKEFRQIWDN